MKVISKKSVIYSKLRKVLKCKLLKYTPANLLLSRIGVLFENGLQKNGSISKKIFN